jgi:hypothetical protein
MTSRQRFHGRVNDRRPSPCAFPGCPEPGEFRAPNVYGKPAGFDGPGEYQWLCLDHVREFNARYDYFSGMSREEIEAAQSPISGWANESRAFAAGGADLPPRWGDFQDPLEAISGRFKEGMARARDQAQNISPEERRALKTLGLEAGAEPKAVRAAYSALVRKYHPDRNGGDRSFEKKLQDVVEAYQLLKAAAKRG